jgi:ketosteroid isomerase-like protein
MLDARSLVDAYFAAWRINDFASMRAVLHDRMEFVGSIETYDSADRFLQAIQRLSQIKDDLTIQKVWADGPDVVVWYDLHTTVAPPAPVAEWHHVENGKVTAMRAVFDARPFVIDR